MPEAIADFFDVTTDYLLGRSISNLSPEILNRTLLADRSAGSVIEDIKMLGPDRKKAIAVILGDMNVSMVAEGLEAGYDRDGIKV